VSLINEVLRNLDERHAAAGERAGLAEHVRALPPVRRFPWARLLPVAAGAALGAVGLWLLLDRPAPPPAATPAATTPLPVAVEAAAAGLPPLVVQLPATEPVAEAEPPPVDQDRNAGLQLDLRLSQPPAAPAATVASSAERRPVAAVHREQAEPVATAIDKQVNGGDTAEAEFRKAMSLVRQGATAEAMIGFQAALRLNGRHPAARQALLSLLVEQRRWPEAQALVTEGLIQDPAQSGWAMALARLQVEQGQLADAEATLARHGPAAAGHADYQAFHALLLQKLRRPGDAAERFRAALVIRPAEGRWWFGLATALEQDQRPAEAREAYQKAREAGNLPPELLALVDQRLR
jgi:MSHA biogenesis protein MshN